MCTDSRAMSAVDAANISSQAIHTWLSVGATGPIVKKIDSTLRGNLGSEIEAVLQAASLSMAILAPAAPSTGRITRDGHCWVYDRLLSESEFATDPKTPIDSSRIAELVAKQTCLKIAELALDEIRDPALPHKLASLQDAGVKIAILDAESRNDLRAIVQASSRLPFSSLLIGAADLCDQVAQRYQSPPKAVKPLLAIIGSMSPMAQQQIHFASYRNDVEIVDIDISSLLVRQETAPVEPWANTAISALSAGKHCIIRTCQAVNQRNDIATLTEKTGLTRHQLGDKIKHFLGELTRTVVLRQCPAGLYLSGGDIAIAVANALNAHGFNIRGQIASSVPWGTFIDSSVGNLLVMTKAGAFGEENTLLDAIRFIEER